MKIDHTHDSLETRRACITCRYDMEFVNTLEPDQFIYGPCFHCDNYKMILNDIESEYCLMCKECIAENEYYRKVAAL